MEDSGYNTPVEGESQWSPARSMAPVQHWDYLRALLDHENEFYPKCNDYLAVLSSFPTVEIDPVSESWRRKLCEWSYEGQYGALPINLGNWSSHFIGIDFLQLLTILDLTEKLSLFL